jgi:hypothetical protein
MIAPDISFQDGIDSSGVVPDNLNGLTYGSQKEIR